MKFGEFVLCVTVGGILSVNAYIAMRAERQAKATEQRIDGELLQCRSALTRTLREKLAAENAVKNVDYFLWEVHEVNIQHDPRDPRQDSQLPALCAQLGDHSVLGSGTELGAYSLWSDATGHQKLGCRYTRRKPE